MSLTLDDGQKKLSTLASVACIPLVVLETFSDRDARTVADTFYWTRGVGIDYEWDGSTAVRFDPLIEYITPVDRGFSHVPDASEYTTREGMRFRIDTASKAGTFLWKTLLDSGIVGARITLGSLLVDFASIEVGDGWQDLSALGRVHVVRWRGEVTVIPELDAEAMTFELVAESEEIKMQATRIMAGVDSADPIDAGKPYPVPIGTQLVEALWYDAGVPAILVSAVSSSATTLSAYIDTDMWLATIGGSMDQFVFTGNGAQDNILAGSFSIGGQECTYDTATLNISTGRVSLTGLSPSRSGTTAIGSTIVFYPYFSRFAISGAPVAGYGDIYATTEHFGRSLLKVDSFGGAFEREQWIENDPAGDAGGHVASIVIPALTTETYLTGGLGDRSKSRLEVEVLGTYTVGSTPTVVMDNSAFPFCELRAFIANNLDTHYHTRYTNIGTASRTTRTNTSAEVMTFGVNKTGLGNARLHTYSFSTGSSTPVEIELTLNFPAAFVAKIYRLILQANTPALQGQGRGALAVPASDIVAGDNTFRFQCFENLGNVMIILILNDVTYEGDFTIQGDYVTYPITVSSPSGSHPIDVAELIVDDFLTTEAVTINAASFATAKTNTPGLEVQFDLSSWQTLGEVLAAIGFNSRTNFVLSETYTGTELKAFNAETDYDFPASTRALGAEFRDMKLTLRPLTAIANRFTALYDLGPSADNTLFESYRKTFAASETDNALVSKVATSLITTSQLEFGARDSVELPFPMIVSESSLIDVLGYYATETLRGQVARYSCVVPWWSGYDIEAGDIVSILPTWETTEQKVRVVRVVFDFNRNGVGLVLESVT